MADKKWGGKGGPIGAVQSGQEEKVEEQQEKKGRVGAGGVPGRPFPWWLTLLAAALGYSLLRYLLPTLQPADPRLEKICAIAPDLAPLVAIPLLLLAAKQLYDVPAAGGEPPSAPGEEPPQE